jgi:hypothetical protein
MEEDKGVKMKPRAVSIILILLLAVSCTSRSGGTLSDKGNLIELKTKEHEMKAVKGNVEEGLYVLLGARPTKQPESLAYLDGKLALMRQADFDRFKAQYGNFKDRKSPGFMEARRTVRRISVIAADGPTQKMIAKFIEQKADSSKKRTSPVIKLTMTQLQVLELKYQKKPVYLSGDIGKQYLITKIEIVKQDYPL